MKTTPTSSIVAALLFVFATALAPNLAAQTAAQITIDYAVDKGAANHIASGFLHGISDPEPSQYLIDGVKVTALRGADHHANEPSLFDPATYARVSQTGAKLMVGLYYYSSSPTNTYWPGDNGDYTTWRQIVTNVYNDAATHGFSVYSWITWNEPTLQWNSTARPISHYEQAHKNAYEVIKALNPAAKIQAPENNSYNFSFITSFLTFCKANNCIPDILSWHELTSGTPQDIEAHTAEIKNWMSSNGITPMPLAVTEYGGGSYGNASTYSSGKITHYIAKLERSAVNGLAFGLKSEWDYVGSDSSFLATLGDSADKTSASLPAGLWWVYHGYKEATGRLVQSTSSDQALIESLAASDSTLKRSVILLGSSDAATPANVTLTIKNLNDASYLINGGKVHLRMETYTPTGVLYTQAVPLEGDYTVSNNAITVALPTLAGENAAKITLTSATSTATTTKYEAESITPTLSPGITYYTFTEAGASGGAAGHVVSTAVNDYVRYTLNVPSAGVYNLHFGLKSESSRAIFQLYINGAAYGGPEDEYGSAKYYPDDFGNVQLPAGNVTFEFRVVAKNSASSNYSMVFDYFTLIKLN